MESLPATGERSNPSMRPNLSASNINRPAVLQPPTQLPSLISNPLLSQALAKPPQLTALIRPSATNSLTPSPILGARVPPVLTAPSPKSFLTMPKNVLSAPVNPATISTPNIQPQPSGLVGQPNKEIVNDLNRTDSTNEYANLTTSRNGNVGNELNNFSVQQLNAPNKNVPVVQNSFFSNSLPATAPAQMFSANFSPPLNNSAQNMPPIDSNKVFVNQQSLPSQQQPLLNTASTSQYFQQTQPLNLMAQPPVQQLQQTVAPSPIPQPPPQPIQQQTFTPAIQQNQYLPPTNIHQNVRYNN